MGHDNVVGQSSSRGAPVVVSLQSESHTLDDTGTTANVLGPTRTELGAGAVDGVVQGEEGEDEAGSQPMEPYVVMRFDSLQIAKDHYNSYALRMDFSVKMNTSRRTARTNVLVNRSSVATRRMMHILAEFYGSEMMVPFGPKSITNLCTSFRRDDTKEGDIIETIAHFKDIQKTDPYFFYKVKYDEEDRVVNIFWMDGLARKAYVGAYHDSISFDTTYMTNMYNMPFTPFTGINRHGQSFMLGCTFVRQELASSFDWVFRAFLEAMDGKPPDNFIIDQDGLSDDFNYCVDFSFTPDKSTWVPRNFKHRFFPFLQSTHRSEGFNAVLKRYVNPHNSMLNFVKQYEKIQNHILAKEGCNDYRTEHLEIELWSNFPIERQAYETYTRDLCRKFREEFELIGHYNAFQVGKGGGGFLFV
ncbi:protein FAR1-RELATED SEQUENCE 5-like [Aegilops tauschii subsp. strangulata]|uniref:protein FAR1-RELATED SEQUENCE 5-like n=1 Tax=Aegilops tauschii subsp. strangulata TaxID=200361 RepID=UPI001ABD412E|nr:protein FAR1-RELATED SEQUENCE 5-like [Aegilops tauschii subsp. strangulata]